MPVPEVKEYLAAFGLDSRVQEFSVSSATVELAAAALGVEPARIAKTLSFRTDDGAMLVVAAGDARIDNAKFKARFTIKAKMLAYDEVPQYIGHAVGGVCPFAIPANVPIYLDESMRRFNTIFPAAGSANSAVEMTPAELEQASRAAAWVDVCKDWA